MFKRITKPPIFAWAKKDFAMENKLKKAKTRPHKCQPRDDNISKFYFLKFKEGKAKQMNNCLFSF